MKRRNFLKSLAAVPLVLLPFKVQAKPKTITFSNFGEAHGLKSGPGIVVTGPNTFVFTYTNSHEEWIRNVHAITPYRGEPT
jgi:hypothetical protein